MIYKLTHVCHIGGFVILLLGMQLHGAAEADNKLCKVYHHRNAHAQTHIELGSVVLYFEHKPIINSLPERITGNVQQNKDQAKTKYTFFLPRVSIHDAACRTMMAKLNAQNKGSVTKGKNYQIRLEEVSKPIQGIKVIISYDTDKVNFSYDYYEADGRERGLIFRFFNKQLLEKIGSKGPELLRTAALVKKKPLVILDFGHGGHDEGAVANSLKEKDITASIGRYLAQSLFRQGIAVELTRNKDCYVSLDERTYRSSKHDNALLFVSLHANAAEDETVAGIETYYLDTELLRSLQAYSLNSITMPYPTCVDIEKDNRQSLDGLETHHMPYKEVILDVLKNRCEESKKLAHMVHSRLLNVVGQKYPIADRRVKPYAYQVLIGSFTPAILIELGFITNKSEAELLKQKEYQQLLADAIAKAICVYIQEC